MEKKLKFAKKENMGYLTFCPSNLGTTMRASVHIRIPTLSQRTDFKAICDKYHLQARGKILSLAFLKFIERLKFFLES